ncbi:amino acid permease [Exiguobacterium indicum]|uniref:amino acid permease n=1 Tax=Exiguobacterium indicum TaxID=296995 RepID=UPI0007370BAC|nr:amino acid permease [Exiguobacterium indicum]KTR62204.1 amino acid permease [Exiguobacterium indicum]
MSLLRKKDVSVMMDMKQHSKLARHLSGFDLILLGIGAIIGTGIFVLTGTGALYAGPALPISFIISAVVCALAALCYAEFSSMIPVSGSVYTYTYATIGEVIAWIIGWCLILEYGLASSAVATGWSGYFQSLLAGFGLHLPTALTAAPGAVPGSETFFNLPAFLILMIITLLLSLGIKETKRVNNIMVLVKVAVVVLFIVVGIWYIEPGNYKPFAPFGMSGVLQASAIAFFAYLGFDAVTSAAEEVKNPGRNLPVGILGSLAIVTVLYVVVSAIMVGIVPFKQFEGVDSPVSLALKVAGQDWVAGFVDLGAIVGMTTVILVMTFGLVRLLFAMSRDGLLPKVFSDVNEKSHTPVKATWILGTTAGLIAGFVPLGTLAELINIGTLAAFSLISIAVIVLRRTRPDLKRAFKVPFVPVLPILSVLACIMLMFNLQPFTWIAFFIWTAIGLLLYFGYGRKRSKLHQ